MDVGPQSFKKGQYESKPLLVFMCLLFEGRLVNLSFNAKT